MLLLISKIIKIIKLLFTFTFVFLLHLHDVIYCSDSNKVKTFMYVTLRHSMNFKNEI